MPQFDHASLVTVISCPTGSALDPAWLQTYIHRQKQVDDVFDAAFLNGIIFTGSKEPQGLVTAQLRELLDRACGGRRGQSTWLKIHQSSHVLGCTYGRTMNYGMSIECTTTSMVHSWPLHGAVQQQGMCLAEKRSGSLIAHLYFQQIYQSTCWLGRVPDSERNSSISHGNLAHKTEATGRPSVRGQGHVQD